MLSRKPLELKQISATYRLDAGKLKRVKSGQPALLPKPKLAVLLEAPPKPDAKPDAKPNPLSIARR